MLTFSLPKKITVNLEILVEKIIFSVLGVTDMLVNINWQSSYDVEPLPFALPYLQKSI